MQLRDPRGFIVLGLATPLYNSRLSRHYILIITYNICSQGFSKFESIFHVIWILGPIFWQLSIHTIILSDKMVCSARRKLVILSILSIFTSNFLIHFTSLVCICWTATPQGKKVTKYTRISRMRNFIPENQYR